ncbi:hypothetical protein ATN00_00580 [Sphingobium baderi]|uniref:Tyr recombinase domain-containing protein n=2 Tax=Sphingobium baderi TaxID=1332080 RepID=A0A0S3EUD1_9SPHN|nr:hypothetical protein ATN00_00580 [Sphingobium baderi]
MKGICQKHGRLYYRRKVGGRDTYIRLPALDDPNFAAAYADASRPDKARAKPAKGTFAALVADYRASSEFTTLSDTTKTNRLRYLDMIVSEHGHRTVAGCRPSDVRKMRDAYASLSGKANNWLATFKALMSYAALNDWRRDNPAREVRKLEDGEHEPWPADVLEQALAHASPTLRLAIITGLCSGARIGDVIKMQHGWHDGHFMQFTTSKRVGRKTVGVPVAVPMHPLWLEEIAKLPRKTMTLIYDRSGKPFADTGVLQERVRTLMKSIGKPTYLSNGKERNYTFHGLRKNAACYLAELGLSDIDIGAICGMTPDTVRHYTKRKRALMIARGAADRVTRGDVLPLKGGRSQGAAK